MSSPAAMYMTPDSGSDGAGLPHSAGPTPLAPSSQPMGSQGSQGAGSDPNGPGRNYSSQPARTPRRELGTARRFITPNTPNTPSDSGSGSGGLQVRAEIWGTTVNIDEARREFERFFRTFPDAHGNPLYPALLQEAVDASVFNLNLNCANLHTFNPELYKQLIIYPSEIIPTFDLVVQQERERMMNPTDDPELAAHLADLQSMQIRPFNLQGKRAMRELNPEDMDTLVAIKGMVIRVGGITPEMQRAFFSCSLCAHNKEVVIEDGVINEPVQCDHCASRHTYTLVHNRCRFNDKQLIKVQETPDSIPEGETPHSIKVFAFDELVDVVKPGDRVEITGIYKAVAHRLNPRRTQLSSVYRTYVDAIHFKKTEVGRLQNEIVGTGSTAEEAAKQAGKAAPASTTLSFDEHDATKEDLEELERKIHELAAQPDIYDRLTRSLAPSIWELEDVKKGILCLLFGGSGAEEGASSGKFRGEINVLMCGDPGTSKSQLLQYVHKIAPRGIYTSGKGSSAVGLTASVVKDAETREMVLESGALVLSDRGVCCIDEFDKMNDATRSILHEVMEQQTVSIAKAGIVCTLNARTSILASANPKESRYNPRLSVVENVQIMPTLLSRFDLIYLVLDQPNESKDRKLAKHLVGLYHETPARSVLECIPMDLLTSYISYARRHVRPVLSPEAEERLIEFYTSMRQAGSNAKVITATPRQLEALIRISEALAKMQLASVVTEEHVHEAKRLMDVATQRAATDPTTGRIDMDLLQTGHSSAERQQVDQLTDALREIIETSSSKSMRVHKLYDSFNQAIQAAEGGRQQGGAGKVSLDRFREVLHVLELEGVIRMAAKDMVTRI